MITPRRTRLLRANNAQSVQQTIAAIASGCDPWAARHLVVIVPSQGAAEQLRQTIEAETVIDARRPSVLAVPPLLTRDAWYRLMHARLPEVPRLLGAAEAEVCVLAAAETASREGAAPPFGLGPGLAPAIVGFYDQLRRAQRTVDSFERLMVSTLEPSAELDRGARRLLQQTHFLVATFRQYEERVRGADRVDEHELRHRLIGATSERTVTRVVVTVGDHIADPAGLWPADFDLLTRLPGLVSIDVVLTERMLATGLHERLLDLLPGLEEEVVAADDDLCREPIFLTPDSGERPYFVWRDREEELRGIVRRLKGRNGSPESVATSHRGGTAIVFQRPLPYLYLARAVFEQTGLPFAATDALPLAAEPYAAAVDLVLEAVASRFDRRTAIALLRLPHFVFSHSGEPLDPASVQALDRVLRQTDVDRRQEMTVRIAEGIAHPPVQVSATQAAEAAPAAAVLCRVMRELSGLNQPADAATQLEVLLAFLQRYSVADADTPSARETRARSAIWSGLATLARAHQLFQTAPVTVDELRAQLRRWIEGQTLSPASGGGGVQLVEAHAALYGRFDEVFLVGMVDGDWPARAVRNIFYPASLLIPLGWPAERDRHRAAQAMFSDLVHLARERVSVSTFSLEDDTIVLPSVLLEDLADLTLQTHPDEFDPSLLVARDDALAVGSIDPEMLPRTPRRWLASRRPRSTSDNRLHGFVGPQPATRYSVSRLERYLECPFRYFAAVTLGLESEAADEMVLSPQRRGLFLHRVLETFFNRWQSRGAGAMTLKTLDHALGEFRVVVDEALPELPAIERAVTRAWLLGSAAAAGVADRLFVSEIGLAEHLVDRLVEYRIDGMFQFGRMGRQRSVEIRGTVDRVDLFSDGSARVVDYKTNRAPLRRQALQLPVYVRCVEQQLDQNRGRRWRVVDASYAAFGEPALQVPLSRQAFDDAVADGEDRVVEVVDLIESGQYPPRPSQRRICTFCAYPTVCRKDDVPDG